MQENKEIKTKDDVVAKASDFVMQYKEVASFSEFYVLDPNVLGEGAFGRV